MFSAHSFVMRSDNNVKFNICIDNEWYEQQTAKEAIKLFKAYEHEQDLKVWDCKDEFEPWVTEVMSWFISDVDKNTIVMNVL